MNTIVTFIAFSDLTPRLIEQTERFAKILDAQVILAHLLPPEPFVMGMAGVVPMTSQEQRQKLIDADGERLMELADRLNREGLTAQAEQLVNADIDTALESCARWKADLIIVGSHHHNALYNAFVGSFREKLLKAAHCPVLVVPEIAVQ